MDKHDSHDPDPRPEVESSADRDVVDKPVSIIPKSVLEYHPRVGIPANLHVDMSAGVILGRSESFHKKYKSTGIGLIGAVTETSDDAVTSLLGMPVNLDLVSPHVMLVAGKRGSGKSYTLGLIAEELARAMTRREIEVAVVIIDTVDVFRLMVEPNSEQTGSLEKWGLPAQGFPAAVYIPRRAYAHIPDEVKTKSHLFPLAISPSELSVSDWGYVVERHGALSTAMENLIGDILDSLRRGYARSKGEEQPPNPDFSIQDMIRCVESSSSIADLYKPSTRTALIQRLRRAQNLGIFHPGGTSAQDLAVAGQITVIDMAPLGSDAEPVLAILTNMLSRQILTYRMAWTDDGTSAREELPPTWLIVDEAQTLVPRSGTTPAKDAIVSYAKLGRRFGCSLVLCTQQPSAVSDEAISQADIVISHSLSHDADIRALQQRAPAAMPEEFKDKAFISGLPRGVALVFDQSTENRRGFIMQARPRMSQHGGTDRLSALLEAARLLPPEAPEVELETKAAPQELSYTEEDLLSGLPDVPRPPLKLSRKDWDVMDDWIKTYVKALFERQNREYAITEESAPRTEEVHPEAALVSTAGSEEETVASGSAKPVVVIEGKKISVRVFGEMPLSLLEKAMLRKVLYSKPSHSFLFTNASTYKETVTVKRGDVSARDVLQSVFSSLSGIGMNTESVVTEDGFTFVLMRKDSVRASLSIGMSGPVVCVPIVFVASDRKPVDSLVGRLRETMR
jgi:hypothetical protein